MYLPSTIRGEKVYTRVEFAKLTGYCVNTLYKWEQNGTLVPKRTARKKRLYYTQSQYEAIMNGEV